MSENATGLAMVLVVDGNQRSEIVKHVEIKMNDLIYLRPESP